MILEQDWTNNLPRTEDVHWKRTIKRIPGNWTNKSHQERWDKGRTDKRLETNNPAKPNIQDHQWRCSWKTKETTGKTDLRMPEGLPTDHKHRRDHP